MRAAWKKSLVSGKQARARRNRKLGRSERAEKAKVRLRDERCRFPLCGCQKQRTPPMKCIPTVSHDTHKGMGGDPTGEVSIAARMILLCKWRHQDAPVSRHAGTMQTRALTPDHNDGPVAFLVDLSAVYPERKLNRGTWYEIARETEIGMVDGLTDEQLQVVKDLAEMTR